MKTFRFRLEALLMLREEEERQASFDYAQARQHREESQVELDTAERARQELTRAIEVSRKLRLQGMYQNSFAQSEQASRGLVDRKAQSVREASLEEASAWQRLVERRRQTEILRQLKNRQRERYEANRRREEQKQLDEAAMQRHRHTLIGHEAVL